MSKTRSRPPGHAPEPQLLDPCAERGAARELLHPGNGGLDVFLSGTVFMDMIFTGLPGLPPPGTELITDGLGSAPGGIANIAVAMSRLGLNVGLAAAFGDDMFGAYLWRTLSEQEGVGLDHSRRLPGWPTPVTVSLAYDSDRSMVTYHRPMPVLPDEFVGTPPAGAYLLPRPRPPGARLGRRRCARAARPWSPTSAGTAPRPGRPTCSTGSATSTSSCPTPSRPWPTPVPTRPRTALDALAERVPVVVVKRGAHGAIAVDATTGERAEAPALPVEALDPTGAGDVFGAAFVYGTLADWPLLERLRFANLCAGLSVRHHSGSLGSPCWGDIAAFGEAGELPEEILRDYAFVVPYIPEAAPETVARAEPTVREAR